MIFLTLICSNFIIVSADVNWNEGDTFVFTENTSQETIEKHNHDDLSKPISTVSKTSVEDVTQLTIASIDTSAKEITSKVYYSSMDTEPFNFTQSYDPQVIATVLASGWITAWFSTNDDNDIVLRGIGLSFPLFFFVEPEWAVVNEGFKDGFDEDAIIYSVSGTDISLADLLVDYCAAFNIMGAKQLDKVESNFKDNTRKWTIELDVSGFLHARLWDDNENKQVYVSYDKYIRTYTYEYDRNGVLSSIKEELEYEITKGDRLTSFTSLYILDTSASGLPFEGLYAIFGLLVVGTAMTLIRRK